MTVEKLAKDLNLEFAAGENGSSRVISGVYICDLLSFAMSKAPKGSAWITIMNNLNLVAAASFADVSCVIICHGIIPDKAAIEKANELGLPILLSNLPAFETGKAIYLS
ncbi:MAG: DRTGG domain-containing protein [Defluviitaleaceae bacterium]|nr:DRTGG domain-containing protein [Defluviitaleaceae bacterium]